MKHNGIMNIDKFEDKLTFALISEFRFPEQNVRGR